MPFDLPQTPQSPFNTPGSTDLSSKSTVSPRINTSLLTPTHSINGSMSNIETSQSEDLSNKRKRDIEDLGGRDQKKVHVEDSRPSIDDLHRDVGKKYLLCSTLHKPHSMSLRQNLYDRFNLNDIAAGVARVTPDGRKNTVRKTYKGYIKSLGIAGQFDAVKGDYTQPGSLYSLVNPDIVPTREVWEEIHVRGREIDQGIPEDLRSSLSKAVTMARGPIPKERFNSSVIGEMGNQVVHDPLKILSPKAKVPIPQGTMGVPKQNRVAADIPRPKRASVKKRSYGDASYEGYGEGYIDDDAEYSAGDGDDRAGGRKRAKKTPTSHSFQGPMRQSYGPGMVGA